MGSLIQESFSYPPQARRPDWIPETKVTRTDWVDLKFDASGTSWIVDLRCCDASGTSLSFPGPSEGAKAWVKGFPEVTDLTKLSPRYPFRWLVPISPMNCAYFEYTWPEGRVRSLDEDVLRPILKAYLARNGLDEWARLQAAWKLSGEVPELPTDWIEHPDPEKRLKGYQVPVVLFGLERPGAAFFLDRGTGKTPISIQESCMEASRQDGTYTWLILAKKDHLYNWARELGRFAVVPWRAWEAVGSPHNRLRTVIEARQQRSNTKLAVTLCSYDSFANSVDSWLDLGEWDKITVDESHNIKDKGTDRWKATKKIRPLSRRRRALTGTPVGNSLLDLYAQLEWVGKHYSGFETWAGFRRFYGQWRPIPNARGIEKLEGVKNVPSMQEQLGRVAFVMSKKEAGIQLPGIAREVITCQMEKRQAAMYRELAESTWLRIAESGDELNVSNQLVMLRKLSQVAAGFVKWDAKADLDTGVILEPERLEWIVDDPPKLRKAVEMTKAALAEDPLCKRVLLAFDVPVLKRLQEMLEEEKVPSVLYYGGTPAADRRDYYKRFNEDPGLRVMVGNPDVVGENLNLIGYDNENPDTSHTYCDGMTFVTRSWSGIARMQTPDRVHRFGQRVQATITDIIVPNTVDEDMLKRTDAKETGAMTVLDIRDMLQRALG